MAHLVGDLAAVIFWLLFLSAIVTTRQENTDA